MWASATQYLRIELLRKQVVIPTHMWASATPSKTVLINQKKSCHTHSHVGFCNMLFQVSSTMIKVVIPTHMWASATCYVLATCNSISVVIPTHMWTSATLFVITDTELQKLSYPLTCGLLQQELEVNSRSNKVVIPTHMWTSATNPNAIRVLLPEVVIPTHMWASATTNSYGSWRHLCCHTHSHVGFCNELPSADDSIR